MKEFITMSKKQAKKYTYKKHDEDYIIISINNSSDYPVKFNRNEKLKDVLYLFFDDIIFPIENLVPMEDIDAWDILGFINKNDSVDKIIIHCTAGISRSVSIKCALEEIYNNKTIGMFPDREKLNSISVSLKELESGKDEITYIFNKLCYDEIKKMYNKTLLGNLEVDLYEYQKMFLRSDLLEQKPYSIHIDCCHKISERGLRSKMNMFDDTACLF